MATLEERVAFLEGRVDEQSQMVTGVREALVSLEQRMDRRFESLEQRMDRRFQVIDQRLTLLDQKLDQRFAWLVGIQLTTLVAIVAALLAR